MGNRTSLPHPQAASANQAVIDVVPQQCGGLDLGHPSDATNVPAPLVGVVTEIEYRNKMSDFQEILQRWKGGKIAFGLQAMGIFVFLLFALLMFGVFWGGDTSLFLIVPIIFVATALSSFLAKHLVSKEISSLKKETTSLFHVWEPRIRTTLEQIREETGNRSSDRRRRTYFNLCFYVPTLAVAAAEAGEAHIPVVTATIVTSDNYTNKKESAATTSVEPSSVPPDENPNYSPYEEMMSDLRS